jgi:hypothetical protein
MSEQGVKVSFRSGAALHGAGRAARGGQFWSDALKKMVASPEWAAEREKLGWEPTVRFGDDFAKFVMQEHVHYKTLLKELGFPAVAFARLGRVEARMTGRHVVTRARVEGLVLLALALGYLAHTRGIPSLYQMPGVPGPAAFPLLVGTVLAVSGLWRMIHGAGRLEAEAEAFEEDAPAASRAGAAAWLARHGRFLALWAVIVAYLAFMPGIGFPVATFAALAALFALLGERRVAVVAGLSLATTVVLYLGFAKGLGVRLPSASSSGW